VTPSFGNLIGKYAIRNNVFVRKHFHKIPLLFRGKFTGFELCLRQPQAPIPGRWTGDGSLPGNPNPERKGNMQTEKSKESKCRYITESFPELSPDIIDLLYKIVFYAQSGLE
jgi:hypothetical protein